MLTGTKHRAIQQVAHAAFRSFWQVSPLCGVGSHPFKLHRNVEHTLEHVDFSDKGSVACNARRLLTQTGTSSNHQQSITQVRQVLLDIQS